METSEEPFEILIMEENKDSGDPPQSFQVMLVVP
jgi:hypothetical protein